MTLDESRLAAAAMRVRVARRFYAGAPSFFAASYRLWQYEVACVRAVQALAMWLGPAETQHREG